MLYPIFLKVLSVTGSLASTIGQYNPFRYRSYYYDTETGFYYLQSRYYDPIVGRFLNADTVGVITASPNGLTDKNLYAYCDNNPIIRVDNGGQFWDTIFDVVSIGFSIYDVCVNPTDPWAWAGLGGDLLDLIPFVSGVGETFRALGAVDNVIDTADNVIDTIDTIHDIEKNADNVVDTTKSIDNIGNVASVKDIPTNDLIPTHELTKGKNKINDLTKNINENGIKEPIRYVDYKGGKYVVDGHHRLEAAKRLRMSSVPAIEVSLPYKGYSTYEELFW